MDSVDQPTLPISKPPAISKIAIVFGMLSALGYTCANVCLRAVADSDPFLVTAVKTSPTAAMAAPWLLWLRYHNQPLAPRGSGIGWLFAAAVLGQIAGNVGFMWSMRYIGMALTVPLTTGCIVFGSAWLGQALFQEKTGLKNYLALSAMAVAIVVLTLGASQASDSMAAENALRATTGTTVLAVIVACVAGFAYALLGAAIRNSVSRGLAVPLSLLVVSSTGILLIGSTVIVRLGETVWSTPWTELQQMLLAGVWNALAFLALTFGLKAAPLYYTNGLNASQIAMASIAGILVYAEPATPALGIGVVLTIISVMLIRSGS